MKPTRRLCLALTLAALATGCGEQLDDPSATGAPATAELLAAAPGGAAVAPVVAAPGVIRPQPFDDFEAAVAIDPERAPAQELERGDGWRRVRVAGNADDGDTGAARQIDDEFYVFNGRASIDKAMTLPGKTRLALAQSMARDGGKASDAARAAGDDPADDEIIIVPAAAARQIEVADQVRTIGWCDDENKTYSKTYSFDKTYNYTKTKVTGSFDGQATFTARLKGMVTGTVKYKVKRDWYTGCVPYAVIQRVTVTGNADVLATANVNAAFEKTWSWEKEIAAPVLGTITLPVVPIPVTFRAPIDVGLIAAAKATLTASGQYQAMGSFDIRCNSDGCSGSKSASHGFTPTGSPSLGASGRVKVTPWIQGGIRAYVISEWVASAEVAVRAGVAGELFGYYGNTCGDADADGTPEWVSAATLDLWIDIDVVAKARFLGDDKGPWTWNVWDRHLAFWKLGANSALNPIFYDSQGGGTMTATMRGKMRPCWPYDDAVNYRITWSDGAITNLTSHPDTLFSSAHDFGWFGSRVVRVDALSDARGRNVAGTTTHNVFLYPVLAPVNASLAAR